MAKITESQIQWSKLSLGSCIGNRISHLQKIKSPSLKWRAEYGIIGLCVKLMPFKLATSTHVAAKVCSCAIVNAGGTYYFIKYLSADLLAPVHYLHDFFRLLWIPFLAISFVFKMMAMSHAKTMREEYGIRLSGDLFGATPTKEIMELKKSTTSTGVRYTNEKLMEAKTWVYPFLVFAIILFVIRFFLLSDYQPLHNQ